MSSATMRANAERARVAGPVAPIEHQRRAHLWLQVCRCVADQGGERATGALAAVDLFEAMRSPMNLHNGAALAGLNDARLPSAGQMAARARTHLHGWRQVLEAARADVLALAAPPRLPDGRADVLVVPRLSGHMHGLLPVTADLRRRGARVVFALPAAKLAGLAEDEGFETVTIEAAVAGHGPGALVAHRLRRSLERVVERATLTRGSDFSAVERRALRAATLTVLRQQLGPLVRAAHGLERLMRALEPRLVVVGNPYTIEGRVAAMLARAHGIPSAALEHGSIFPDDPIWRECAVDLVCAFGEPSRRALLSCGVAPEAIAVTGSPKLDKVVERRGEPGPAKLLVATSGAGDQVSAESHARFIDWLYAAAEATPEARWVVKLHSKDPPALYLGPALRHPRANVEVRPADQARFGADIFDHLRGARALVTVCSTTALDAMIVGVPVITVVPGPVPRGIDFLERGCTRRADSAEDLAREARRAWAEEAVPDVDQAARAYAYEHHANLGRATLAVADRLEERMRERAHG